MNEPTELERLWLDEYTVGHDCGLCGNSGIIDTRETVKDTEGEPCGGRFFCICPNGRKRKELMDGVLPKER